MKLYFLTTNPFKIAEAKYYATWRGIDAKYGLELTIVEHDVQEILHPDVEVMVRHKAVEAYKYMRYPCVVEHGGLFMDALPGLPGGVGKIVWNAVGEKMCAFLGPDDSRKAAARSYLGFCDGRHVRVHIGETRGRIAEKQSGDYKFAWDPIFVPENSEVTYGVMGFEGKKETSPSVKAWDKFLDKEQGHFNVAR